MFSQRKLNASGSPMTSLKRLWRDSFSEDERDYWREQFISSRSQAALRKELHQKYGIALRYDNQLNRFREWIADFDAREEEHGRVADERMELESQGLTPDELCSELLFRMKARALVRGDFKLGLKAIAAEVKVETLQLAREKFRHSKRANPVASREYLNEKSNHQDALPSQKAGSVVVAHENPSLRSEPTSKGERSRVTVQPGPRCFVSPFLELPRFTVSQTTTTSPVPSNAQFPIARCAVKWSTAGRSISQVFPNTWTVTEIEGPYFARRFGSGLP